MSDVILFAGTTEGRLIAEACRGKPLELYVCVATEYGQTLIEPAENIHVLAGGKNESGIEKLLLEHPGSLVIDATHPYAQGITEDVAGACARLGMKYVRVLRAEQHEGADNCVFVENTAAAAEYLENTTGNILLTVGSKELAGYTGITNYRERVFARILPMQRSINGALELGFEGKNLICMQGPFTKELNAAMLRMLDIKYLVTKDTGAPGGFGEKLAAAAETDVKVIVIERPKDDT